MEELKMQIKTALDKVVVEEKNYYKNEIKRKQNDIDTHKSAIAGKKQYVRNYEELLKEFTAVNEILIASGRENEFGRVSQLVRDRINEYRNSINNHTGDISYYQKRIEVISKDLEELIEKLAEAEKKGASNKEVEKIFNEIKNIETIKKVDSVSLTNNSIKILTKFLEIHEPVYGKNFPLGKMEIHIPFDKSYYIKIFNNTKRVDGYSGYMHHPHIFSDGNPCWGTASDSIAQTKESKDYYLLTILIMNFLQTCDIKDEAGRYVPTWADGVEGKYIYNNRGDIVDAYGDEVYCEVEDEYWEYGERERRICDCCGSVGCSNCVEEYEIFDGSHVWLCDDCYSCAEVCEECGGLIPNGYGKWETSDETYICDNCRNLYHTNNYGFYERNEERNV